MRGGRTRFAVAGARERDVPVSQVSRTLARLRKACGARLMHRTTTACR
jgi:DNA-binding transcriptional LysR family regulator